MTEFIILILSVTSIGTIGFGLFLYLAIFQYEKFEKAIARLLRFLNIAHKSMIKYDLEGSINDYVNQLSKTIPELDKNKVKIEYVDDKNINKKTFLSNGNLVIRLRKDDPKSLNFVHGTYIYISTNLLKKVKRHISHAQREAIDLFVVSNLIENEKPEIIDYFLENYLHPLLNNPSSNRVKYFKKYSQIDKGGLFFPVFLKEMHSLGSKIYLVPKCDDIIIEVDELISFLETKSLRIVGDEEQSSHFIKEHCSLSVMIVGKRKIIDRHSSMPYENFIRDTLCNELNINTIYILGMKKNFDFINTLANDIYDIYWKDDIIESKAQIHLKNGEIKEISQLTLTLHRIGQSILNFE